MRRDNVFRPVCAGGLGLVHLFIKQLVSRFFYFRDCAHPLLRTFVQVNFADVLPSLVVSTYFASPPYLQGFMREVYESVRFLTARFSHDYLFSISRKELYNDLLDMLFPAPLYRSLYIGLSGHDVLVRVKKMPISPISKTFFYKVHTETLPVKAWLSTRGIFVSSINCRLCDVPETIEHCFISCKDAILFWDVLQRAFKKQLDLNPHSIRYLVPPKSNAMPVDMLLLMGMHSLWKTRMLDRHAEPMVSSRSHFVQMTVQLKDFYEQLQFQPDWYPQFMESTALIPF
uniref:Reverse transcriptase zinc-binding domain-containing protein n=1 Tax=Rhipicephalus pulchellus TaxID=72859 RepID=L7LZK6_RHIPC